MARYQKGLEAISTHAPRTGSDFKGHLIDLLPQLFQPTLPARGATILPWRFPTHPPVSTHAPRTGSDGSKQGCSFFGRISTHAPRTGSDRTSPRRRSPARNFNPRSPHGERPSRASRASQPPAISTHAPRTGSDENGCHVGLPSSSFQPTLPARGATAGDSMIVPHHFQISTHAPRTGSDKGVDRHFFRRTQFQPTLPARGATRSVRKPL